ncbi:HD domain-containing protein [Lysobacter sp. FW306-1B-D06B]|uniref:HD domain-containing protein n=1 Tax=Lysobacter sp. FW306-1B-D06B TaxID=3140250 RepID=UPI0031407EBF
MNQTTANATQAVAPSGRALPTRMLAGVEVPDTPLVSRAIEYARAHCEPYLFNHVMRSWLFAAAMAGKDGTAHDPEVLAVVTLLHDLGLAEAFQGPLRFEVEGANAARTFARAQGLDEHRCQLVWDGVALNSTPSICLHKESEVALGVVGVGLDWGGWGFDAIPTDVMANILEAFPRLQMKQRFTDDVCRIARTRPETTYDNFARDFGLRFVPGYDPGSSVDALMGAPFDE